MSADDLCAYCGHERSRNNGRVGCLELTAEGSNGFCQCLAFRPASQQAELVATGPKRNPDLLRYLVQDFSTALLEKLEAAEAKYGYNDGWIKTDWREGCLRELVSHIRKGDPCDVAAYCAFAWHHEWSLSGALPESAAAGDTSKHMNFKYEPVSSDLDTSEMEDISDTPMVDAGPAADASGASVEETLLPCPFCGSKAELLRPAKAAKDRRYMCGKVGCPIYSQYMTRDHWNTRVAAPTSASVEEIEREIARDVTACQGERWQREQVIQAYLTRATAVKEQECAYLREWGGRMQDQMEKEHLKLLDERAAKDAEIAHWKEAGAAMADVATELRAEIARLKEQHALEIADWKEARDSAHTDTETFIALIEEAKSLRAAIATAQAERDEALAAMHQEAQAKTSLTARVEALTRERDRSLETLVALEKMYAWKSMESAPMDGSVVIGKLPESDVPHSVRFIEGRWVVAWDNHYLSKYDQPTHWLSLKHL